MTPVIFNKDFQGHVTIIGQAGSGKTSCAGLIARKAIDARKNVLWINTDDHIETLRWRIYGNIPRHQAINRGRVFIPSIRPGTLSPAGVKLILNEAFKTHNKINMVIVSDAGFGDYINRSNVIEMFHSLCFLQNVQLVCTAQAPRSGDIKAFSTRVLAMSDFVYHLNAEDSDMEFEDFKLSQIKQRPGREDIFIADSNEWKCL